jgi:hypothetical protein
VVLKVDMLLLVGLKVYDANKIAVDTILVIFITKISAPPCDNGNRHV